MTAQSTSKYSHALFITLADDEIELKICKLDIFSRFHSDISNTWLSGSNNRGLRPLQQILLSERTCRVKSWRDASAVKPTSHRRFQSQPSLGLYRTHVGRSARRTTSKKSLIPFFSVENAGSLQLQLHQWQTANKSCLHSIWKLLLNRRWERLSSLNDAPLKRSAA